MGTSITSGLRAPDAYITPLTVGERLGMTSHNVGIEGACVGYYGDPNDPMSLSGLTDAIISKDWSAQESAAKNMDVTLSPIIAKLKLIDFDKVSVLGLEYGLNDFTLHVPIGGNTEVAKNTFKGALNCSIQRLLTAFPKLNLFLMTPAWSLPRP